MLRKIEVENLKSMQVSQTNVFETRGINPLQQEENKV